MCEYLDLVNRSPRGRLLGCVMAVLVGASLACSLESGTPTAVPTVAAITITPPPTPSAGATSPPRDIDLAAQPVVRCEPPPPTPTECWQPPTYTPQPTTCSGDTCSEIQVPPPPPTQCTTPYPTATPVVITQYFELGHHVQVGPVDTEALGIEIWIDEVTIYESVQLSDTWLVVWDVNVKNNSTAVEYEFGPEVLSYIAMVELEEEGTYVEGEFYVDEDAMQEAADEHGYSFIYIEEDEDSGDEEEFSEEELEAEAEDYEDEYVADPGETETRLLATYVPGPVVIRVAFLLEPSEHEEADADTGNIAYWVPNEENMCPYGTLPPAGSGLITLLRQPVDGGTVSQAFGCTENFTGVRGSQCPSSKPWFHNGVDFAVPAGSVYYDTLPVDGQVTYAGEDSEGTDCSSMVGSEAPHTGLGNYVLHTGFVGDHLVMVWGGHLTSTSVTTGDGTEPGQELGLTGSTGCSSGAHLHYAVMVDGVYVDPMLAFP